MIPFLWKSSDPRLSSRGYKETAKLIYIGGLGRSGSTLLERLLTADAEVVACGEVARHLQRRKDTKTCSCRQPLALCRVWNPFRHKRDALKHWDHRRLTVAMLDHISHEFSVMVDSSKTAWGSAPMPFRLRQDLGDDFLLVHLVRDPRGVCWSTIRTLRRRKAGGRELGRCVQTVFGWLYANLACEAYALIYRKQYLRLRYEDIVEAPRQVLAPLFGRVALASNLENLEKYDNRHQLHGNRMRRKLITLKDLRQDVAWKTKMPWSFRWLIALMSWPLAARYGYFKASREPS